MRWRGGEEGGGGVFSVALKAFDEGVCCAAREKLATCAASVYSGTYEWIILHKGRSTCQCLSSGTVNQDHTLVNMYLIKRDNI